VNKTIYVRDEDVTVWDHAKELAGEKLAPVIIDGLKKFVIAREAEDSLAKGFERIEVGFNDADDHNIPRRKAFIGRWIFPPTAPTNATCQDNEQVDSCAVALTPKGAAVFYSWTADREGMWGFRFDVFPSLEEAARHNRLDWAARQTIRKIGVPVEELDI